MPKQSSCFVGSEGEQYPEEFDINEKSGIWSCQFCRADVTARETCPILEASIRMQLDPSGRSLAYEQSNSVLTIVEPNTGMISRSSGLCKMVLARYPHLTNSLFRSLRFTLASIYEKDKRGVRGRDLERNHQFNHIRKNAMAVVRVGGRPKRNKIHSENKLLSSAPS